MFGNYALNEMFRDATITKCKRIIVKGGLAVPVCILGDPAYPLLPFLMKEFSKGGKILANVFFGQRLPSVKNCYRERIWVIKTTVWMLKKRNGHKSLRTSCSNSLVFYST